jgi:8-oxo-dGTP diphosphatase
MAQPDSERVGELIGRPRGRPIAPRRKYPDGPIPGVGAVVLRGVGADEAHFEVLLVKRGREPMAGSWSLPGGGIELGEMAAAACAREVLEETGLKVEVIAPIETVDIILRDEAGRVRFHYVILDMLCRVTGEEEAGGELRAGEDASDAVWAGVDSALESEVFALTPRACTVIRKALTMIGDGR